MDITNYLKNIDKKTLAIYVVIAVLLLALIGYFLWNNLSKNNLPSTESAELELRKLIESNLETWPLYEKISDVKHKKFGNDETCSSTVKGNEDFLNYEAQAQKGDAYMLDLTNGAYVVYTPNYNNWDNNKLHSFTSVDMRMCGGDTLIPLAAYTDKIVWGNIKCIDADQNQINACLKITQIVMGYFTGKPQ